jgi:hypothetical protein
MEAHKIETEQHQRNNPLTIIMKINNIHITILLSLLCEVHCRHGNENEVTSKISSQRGGWFRRRRIDNANKNDLIHRHDMHSFTGTEGIDHTSDKGAVAEDDVQTADQDHHVDTHASGAQDSRRRRIDHFKSHHVAAKPVKQVQQKNEEEYPGESL